MKKGEVFLRSLWGLACLLALSIHAAGAWGATVTVTNDNDSGPGSLRWAIEQVNASEGADVIQINIPGTGVHTIAPVSPLPEITKPFFLDGTTQPAFAGLPLIELNGANAGTGANGLDITGGSSTVRGLVINGFGGNQVQLRIKGGNVVEGNFIGINAAGTAGSPNSSGGVRITSANNLIGGTQPGAGNVISGNSQRGIGITGSGATGNLVQGNFIGTDAAGTAAVPNFEGVQITNGASGNTIGGIVSGAGNVISGNLFNGVHPNNSASNQILGNKIGTDSTGTQPLGNGQHGVLLDGGANNNAIGGPSAGNTIAFNGGAGVSVFGNTSIGNLISQNSIFDNGILGIDLGNDGVTPNDAGDADTGPNNLQNFPALTSATRSGNSITVQGTLNSTPNSTFTLEFFATTAADPEGDRLLGLILASTDYNGNASFTGELHVVFGDTRITATATGSDGTSELSEPIPVPPRSDGTPPTITCPGNIVANTPPDKCQAEVGFTPAATGDEPPTVVCSPSSGSLFPLDATTVLCNASNSLDSANCFFTVTVKDTVPPIIDPGGVNLSPSASDPPNCSYKLPDFFLSSTVSDNCTPPPSITHNQIPKPESLLKVGPQEVFLTATDGAGNLSPLSLAVTVVDDKPPLIKQCPTDKTIEMNANTPSPRILDLTKEVVASDCTEPITVTQIPGAETLAQCGNNPVTITVKDGVGNASICTATVTVRDQIPPEITGGPALVTLTAVDNCFARLEDLRSQFNITDNCTPGSALSISQVPLPGTLLGIGKTTLTVTAEDASGNRTSVFVTVNVVDRTPPSILQCPANGKREAGPDCQAPLPDLIGEVIAIDNCPAPLTITQSPNPGTSVGLGVSAVTITVRDAAENETTCLAGMTVQDRIPPAITQCPAPRTLSVDAHCQAAMPNLLGELQAADNCTDDLSKAQSPGPGALLGLGFNQPMTFTVTDGINESACAGSFSVVDQTPPAILCPANLTTTPEPGQCSAAVSYSPVATDNCQNVEVLCHPPSGSSFPKGTTTISCTATDRSNNSSACSFTATVVRPLSITSFMPTCAIEGQSITVTGVGFTGATAVTIGNAPAVFNVDSDTQITVTVPPGAAGGPISVTQCGESVSSSSSFTVASGPIISSITSKGKPGSTVTIKGKNLLNASGVAFGDLPAEITKNTATLIKVKAPPEVMTDRIAVTAGDCTGQSARDFFAPPSMTSFDPPAGQVGSTVTLKGLNFTGATSVLFRSTRANFTVVDNTTIIATVPAKAKSGTIKVTAPAGSVKSETRFSVTP